MLSACDAVSFNWYVWHLATIFLPDKRCMCHRIHNCITNKSQTNQHRTVFTEFTRREFHTHTHALKRLDIVNVTTKFGHRCADSVFVVAPTIVHAADKCDGLILVQSTARQVYAFRHASDWIQIRHVSSYCTLPLHCTQSRRGVTQSTMHSGSEWHPAFLFRWLRMRRIVCSYAYSDCECMRAGLLCVSRNRSTVPKRK